MLRSGSTVQGEKSILADPNLQEEDGFGLSTDVKSLFRGPQYKGYGVWGCMRNPFFLETPNYKLKDAKSRLKKAENTAGPSGKILPGRMGRLHRVILGLMI